MKLADQQEMFPELESVREDLRSSLTGITQELLTQILSNPALKLEKTITSYDSEAVLPLTIKHLNYKVGTSHMQLKLCLKLRLVDQDSSVVTSAVTLDLPKLSQESEKSSLKPEQMELNMDNSTNVSGTN